MILTLIRNCILNFLFDGTKKYLNINENNTSMFIQQ